MSLLSIAPGIRAEFRPQPSGSIVYVLFDRYSRAIGSEEIFGSHDRAVAAAKTFAGELIAAHQVAL